MATTKTVYTCQTCGASQPKWLGKCPSCGQWNTLAEERVASKKGKHDTVSTRAEPVVLGDLHPEETPRIATGIGELDRVVGGGFVHASAVLIGGDPGIGKSTLLLQCAEAIANKGIGVLYITAEEAPQQIRLRADRLNLTNKHIQVLGESDADQSLEWARKLKPGFVVVDSIQTQRRRDFDSAPGTVTQVREVASSWADWGRQSGAVVTLVGHVTKEGALAGPRVIEHLVDTVLMFEGEQGGDIRLLRSLKNRYGATGELGVFEMQNSGLKSVRDASSLFLSTRSAGVAGVAITPVMRGSRPLLIEVQALATRSLFAAPQRNATGVDQRRLSLWIAVLEKRVGLVLAGEDVFINATGGIKLEDAAADLAACTAIASSLKNQPVDPKTVLIGEVGLTGEVRNVHAMDRRLQEAAHLGFTRAIVPAAGWKSTGQEKLEIVPVHTLEEAIDNSLE